MAGLICLISLLLILAGLGLIPVDPDSFNAPHRIVALCGLVFLFAGASVLLAGFPRLRLLMVALTLATFGSVAAWVALFSGSEGWQSNMPLPGSAGGVIGRLLAGLGALILYYGCFDVIRRMLRHGGAAD